MTSLIFCRHVRELLLAEFLAFLKEGNKKFVEAYAARDAATLASIFAPGARIMPPNHPMFEPNGMSPNSKQLKQK